VHGIFDNSHLSISLKLHRISGLLSKRIFTFYLRNDFCFNLTSLKRRQDELLKILHSFTDEVIVSRREEIMKGDKVETSHDQDDIGVKKKMAFLDVLLQSTIDGKPLTNMDIREEVDTFMFEGHDTTTSGIAFCLYNLAKHPEVQKKAYGEVKNVIGDDLDTPVSIKLLNDLNYLELVIKETLRLYPSVPMYGRKIKENIDMSKISEYSHEQHRSIRNIFRWLRHS
jgi:cytochrome P450 family 4